MKFGLLKSKIEEYLIESYENGQLDDALFVFNQMVSKNKNISKLYFLYDELSKKKGLSENVANEYINESINIYENTVNKISRRTLDELKIWVSNVKTKNNYEDIDNLFSNDVLQLENKIKSKKIILESIKTKENDEIKGVKSIVPIKKLVTVANKTINNYIESLSESEKKELKSIIKEDDKRLEIKFESIKETTLKRLENMKIQESDRDVLTTIDETINKITSEKFNRVNYVKLKSLNESI
jgi:hypothetical protein